MIIFNIFMKEHVFVEGSQLWDPHLMPCLQLPLAESMPCAPRANGWRMQSKSSDQSKWKWFSLQEPLGLSLQISAVTPFASLVMFCFDCSWRLCIYLKSIYIHYITPNQKPRKFQEKRQEGTHVSSVLIKQKGSSPSKKPPEASYPRRSSYKPSKRKISRKDAAGPLQ